MDIPVHVSFRGVTNWGYHPDALLANVLHKHPELAEYYLILSDVASEVNWKTGDLQDSADWKLSGTLHLVAEDLSNGRLQEMLDYAAKDPGLQFRLLRELYHLGKNRPGRTLRIMSDFAPLSLYWEITEEDGSRYMNGGLIHYKPHETGVDAPQFSVSLGGATNPEERWEVHT